MAKNSNAFKWKDYPSKPFYDELITTGGRARPASRSLIKYLNQLGQQALQDRKDAADVTIEQMGISFTVYSDGENIDRAWPFDIIPRVIDKQTWEQVEKGLKQRLIAINHFIDDLYHDQNVIKDSIIPEYIIEKSKNFRPECKGISPPHSVWAHICGTDLVRDEKGQFFVLEDNLRVPSGVSYMIENRAITKRVLPDLFESIRIEPNNAYTSELLKMLKSLSPRSIRQPQIVVLTPGIFNSAYFEHAFLAQQMGAELVEGSDLVVKDDTVFMKTIAGLQQVDVIYRRIDDWFLDPKEFNKESTLGVSGLMNAWREGNVALANAPGAGVADDKVVYAYVPSIIEYYLNEKPILPNVETFLCDDPEQRQYVLDHLEELVVKPANESGGYGMLVGPQSTKKMRDTFTKLIKKNPRNYIAQPTLKLSTAPTLCDGLTPKPRHLDLRPFVLQGKSTYCTKGGLTRVALRQGSLVVNSSQGGGSKDTWIVDEELS
jgi:uncharacterized circularly permuted ATP-grasp superfamily protein